MDNKDSEKKKLIDRFLLEQLSTEEKKQFTQYMNDPDFQKEVEFQRAVMETIEYQGDLELKTMLKKEEQAIKKSKDVRSIKLFSFRRIAAAAAIFLLLIFISWKFLISTPADLFAENFKPPTNTLFPIQKSSEQLNEIEQTFSLYETGRYKEALLGFEKILSKSNNDDISFYHSNTLLAVGKTEEAISILQQIILNKTSDYIAPAKWYLALAYISQNNFSDAKPLLEELIDDPFHTEKVKKLLRETVFQEKK